MVAITLSAAGAKNAANRLREFLAIDGINLKQTHAYEALAQTLGYANWNTLQALLNGTAAPQKTPDLPNSSDRLPASVSLFEESWAEDDTTDNNAARADKGLIAQRLAEQAAPRTAIPLDPAKFDRFVGHYQMSQNIFFTVTRDGDQFLMGVGGGGGFTLHPESETKFFTEHGHAQISFNLTAQNFAESAVLHHLGREHLMKRVDAAVVSTFENALQKYVAGKTPTPEREVLLRRLIAAR